MGYTFLALVMTVLMGGIIAYYGDLIGRKLGKKRITFYGLRPKYTAVLITSLTGGAISLLSILTLFLIDSPVRNIILHGEKAINSNRELIKQQKLEAAIDLHQPARRDADAHCAFDSIRGLLGRTRS